MGTATTPPSRRDMQGRDWRTINFPSDWYHDLCRWSNSILRISSSYSLDGCCGRDISVGLEAAPPATPSTAGTCCLCCLSRRSRCSTASSLCLLLRCCIKTLTFSKVSPRWEVSCSRHSRCHWRSDSFSKVVIVGSSLCSWQCRRVSTWRREEKEEEGSISMSMGLSVTTPSSGATSSSVSSSFLSASFPPAALEEERGGRWHPRDTLGDSPFPRVSPRPPSPSAINVGSEGLAATAVFSEGDAADGECTKNELLPTDADAVAVAVM
mmetsp:Transcript_3694/g.8188  ORF Transcript_3694/g.8188 Transcript_3694/m.8188 type:complete len:267 (-) Transcript_3694:627-1427(-)